MWKMEREKEIFSKQGKFWFAGAPTTAQAFGVLSVTSNGTTHISLAEGLDFEFIAQSHPGTSIHKLYRIFGVLDNGNRVLLPEAHIQKSSLTAKGFLANSIQSSACIIAEDYEFEEKSDPKIESVHFSLEPVLGWFRPDLPVKGNSEGKPHLVLPPQFEETYTIFKGSIHIENEIRIHYDLDRRKAPLEQRGHLAFTPNILFSLRDAIEFTKSIEDFLMLFTDQTVDLCWPTIQLSSELPKAKFYFSKVETITKEFSYNKCWIHYHKLQSVFGKLLEAWLLLKDSFGPAFYLYAGNRRATSMYDENRFMNCITGLESLHYKTGRAIKRNPKLERKVSRIVDALSPTLKTADRRWAKSMGEQCLQPTLSERLEDLFLSLRILQGPKAIKAFSERCAKLRNDISHYGGPRSRTEDYRDFVLEIHVKYRALQILYHALLLDQIGVNPSLIESAMHDSFAGGEIKYELKAAGLNVSSPSSSATSSASSVT